MNYISYVMGWQWIELRLLWLWFWVVVLCKVVSWVAVTMVTC